jgi:four helix bundle protein
MPRRIRPPRPRALPRLRAVAPAGRVVPSASDALLDGERFDVYAAALEFHLLAVAVEGQRSGPPSLRDQLERASASVVLNAAEGAGRVTHEEKAKHYALARDSAAECAALVDTLGRRGLMAPETAARARSLAARILRMVTRLGHRFGLRGDAAWSRYGDAKTSRRGKGH